MKLRELSDLLQELESAKFEGYLPGLSYLDTVCGTLPIVDKLPFAFFCDFIIQETRVRNDPSFRLLTNNTAQLKSVLRFKNQGKSMVFAHKTEVSQEKDTQDGSSYTADVSYALSMRSHIL